MVDRIKIQFLQDWKHEGVDFESGDIKSFDAATGAYFCKAGVGKDLSGAFKTEAIDNTKTVRLDVANVTHKMTSENK